MSDKKETLKTIKTEALNIADVIGSVFGQTITGTLFKHKVLKYLGDLAGNRQFLVKNVETGFKHVMSESDLHCL